MKLTNFLLILCLQTGSLGAFAQSAPPPLRPSKKALSWADKTLKKMSVDEKIGQLIHVGINARYLHQQSAAYRELHRHVTENHIGGIIFFVGPVYETVHLANRMQAAAKAPLLISLDAETGVGMRFLDAEVFPWAMAVAATGEPELARRMGEIAGIEARALGFQHVFAPVVDVNNNAANPVINVRSFGEDPEDVSRYANAFIRGLQSQRVLATAKHFPGHGDTSVDSHRGLPIIDLDRDRLDHIELLPFRRAIEAGVGSIMIGHIAVPQIDGEEIKPLEEYKGGDAERGAEIVVEKATIPASLSHTMQTEMLRRQMGFDGLIVSDALSMSGLTLYFTQEEAGVRALLAGTDMLLKPADVDAMIRGLKAAVAGGRVPMARLDEAVRRQLAWKHELGLAKQKITPLDRIDQIVSAPRTTELANEIGEKAVTLVRHHAGTLPLDRSKKIAVLGFSNGFEGPGTMAPLIRSLRSEKLEFTSVYLQENSLPDQVAAARKAAAEADIVIAGLYGRVRTGAKNSVGIPDNGAAILREALAADKQVIGISFGNPYILADFPELKTYIVAYGDMPSLQRAAARALLGQQNFTGRLPITLPGLHPRGTGNQYPPVIEVISAPRPAYPIHARLKKVIGDVKVEVSIDPQGNVSSTRLIYGDPLLQEVSLSAARKLKFAPSGGNTTRFSLVIYRFHSVGAPIVRTCCEDYPYIISIYPR